MIKRNQLTIKHQLFLINCFCMLISCAYGFTYLLPMIISQLQGNTIDVGITLASAGITTIIFVGMTGALANRYGIEIICAFSSAICCLSFALFYYVDQINIQFYLAGAILGIGWSFLYAALPMLIVRIVKSEHRAKYLSYLAAFVIIGLSIGPVIGKYLLAINMRANTIFICPLLIAILTTFIFLGLHYNYIYSNKFAVDQLKIVNTIKISWREIINLLLGAVKYPLIMAFIVACIFSVMMNFQATYADTQGLNFSIYYVLYMLTVIGCRFTLGSKFTQRNPVVILPYLLILIGLGLILMLLNSGSECLYGLSAITIGLGLGLLYPLLETYTVNLTAPRLHNHIITYFTLTYLIGIYAFPLLSSVIIEYGGFSYLLVLLILLTLIGVMIGFKEQARK